MSTAPPAAFGAVGGTPPFMKRGDGAYLYDVDGNRFIDYIGSWGPHLFGHRHPMILQAIQGAMEVGTSFSASTKPKPKWPNALRKWFPPWNASAWSIPAPKPPCPPFAWPAVSPAQRHRKVRRLLPRPRRQSPRRRWQRRS
ncbi:MAG UNVERIFIED_CONTAM: aminotransferase class III-fold pyridoxal phosphate-dependent enzyme [Planctomycetaceae bacterium]